MLFLLAYSPTFLAKIAPKMSPKPQLNNETITVRNVTMAEDLAVFVQYLLVNPIILDTGEVSAKV